MDKMTKKSSQRFLLIGYKNLKPIYVSELLFADDLVIIANSERNLQDNLEAWNQELTSKSMSINLKKTQVMALGTSNTDMNIKIGNIQLQQTSSYKYLGTMISSDGGMEAELNSKMEAASKLYFSLNKWIFNKKELSKQTKIRVYNSLYIPALYYSSETWTLTKKQQNRLQAKEMKCLRRIEGVTKKDKIRSSEIRNRLEVKTLKGRIEANQLRWLGHLHRMKDTRHIKKVWEAKATGKRSRGRPKTTWNKAISKILEDRDTDWTRAKKLAGSRKEWETFCKGNGTTTK